MTLQEIFSETVIHHFVNGLLPKQESL